MAGSMKDFIEHLAYDRFAAQASQAGKGENDGVELAVGKLSQACIDIAAQRGDPHGRESMPQLNLSAQAAGANSRRRRKGIDLAPIGDQRIPWILPLRE